MNTREHGKGDRCEDALQRAQGPPCRLAVMGLLEQATAIDSVGMAGQGPEQAPLALDQLGHVLLGETHSPDSGQNEGELTK